GRRRQATRRGVERDRQEDAEGAAAPVAPTRRGAELTRPVVSFVGWVLPGCARRVVASRFFRAPGRTAAITRIRQLSEPEESSPPLRGGLKDTAAERRATLARNAGRPPGRAGGRRGARGESRAQFLLFLPP